MKKNNKKLNNNDYFLKHNNKNIKDRKKEKEN